LHCISLRAFVGECSEKQEELLMRQQKVQNYT